MKNYYQILGISKNASQSEIKGAYRKAALFWHPDKNKSPNAKDKFIEIQEAYEVLIDAEKRQIYNSLFFKSTSYSEENKESQTKPNYTANENNKTTSFQENKEYQKFEDWLSNIRKKAKKKANMPYVDDILTNGFDFLNKYGIWIIMAISLIVTLIIFSVMD